MKNIPIFSSQSFEPLMKWIEGLDRPKRIAIYLGSTFILMALFGYLSFYPMYMDISRYKDEYNSTQSKLELAKSKAAKLEEVQNKRKMAEMEFKKSMKALPEKKEIPSLLTSISQSGQDSGIEFVSFEPKAETNKDFYAEIPVDMEMIGGFHNVVMFFDRVTSLNRIVNIRNMQLTISPPSKDDTKAMLKTKCQAVTYKFIEPGSVPDPKNKAAQAGPKETAPVDDGLSKKQPTK